MTTRSQVIAVPKIELTGISNVDERHFGSVTSSIRRVKRVRTTLRALVLRQIGQGQSTPAVGANLGLSSKAVWQIGRRLSCGWTGAGVV
jgi:hypothetical protein